MNCTHPGCNAHASSRSPLYCWGHYIEHVLLMRPCPGAPKRVRLVRTVSSLPLRRRLDAIVARQNADRTITVISTYNHVANEVGMSPETLAQVYSKDVLRWDVADRLCCKLGIPTATLYGLDWQAMDVEDAA